MAEDKEDLMWSNSMVADLTEDEVQQYQDFACCASIPGNGTNKEYALHLLAICRGDVKVRRTVLLCIRGVVSLKITDLFIWS